VWECGSEALQLPPSLTHPSLMTTPTPPAHRAPTTSMTLVQWASTRRGAGAAAAATAPSLQPQHTISSSYPSTVLSSEDGGVGLDGSGGSSNLQAASLQQQLGAPGTPVAAAASASAGSVLSALPDWHLVTGHADGAVVVWDRGADTLRPVLLILPAERCVCVCVCVCASCSALLHACTPAAYGLTACTQLTLQNTRHCHCLCPRVCLPGLPRLCVLWWCCRSWG
jgi:hypothetical protein